MNDNIICNSSGDSNESVRERRLCHLEGESALSQSNEVLKKESGFTAKMMEIARSIPQPQRRKIPEIDIPYTSRTTPEVEIPLLPAEERNLDGLLDDENWRNAWLDTYTYLGQQGIDAIDSPHTFLLNLDKKTRKQYLMEYLHEKIPFHAVRTYAPYNYIAGIDFETLDQASAEKLVQQIRQLMFIDRKMNNVDTTDDEALIRSNPSSLKIVDLENAAKDELTTYYKGGSNAIADFNAMRDENPNINSTISSDPVALRAALRNKQTRFAGALNYNVFTADQLRAFTNSYEQRENARESVVVNALQQRESVRLRVEDQERISFVERLKDNFSRLEGWQKLAIIGAGAAIVHWTFFKKGHTSNRLLRGLAATAIGVTGFYLIGGRKMFEGTLVGDTIAGAEKKVKETKNRVYKRPPELAEKELRTYSRYLTEIAGEDMNSEIEAMGYISHIPMGIIANSFTLQNEGRDGALDFGRKSALTQSIQEIFGESGSKREVLQKLQNKSAVLGDGMAHVFYMLGAMEEPTVHQQIEKARGGQEFDAITGPERKLYEGLAIRGLAVARDQYKDMNWYQVIEKMAK